MLKKSHSDKTEDEVKQTHLINSSSIGNAVNLAADNKTVTNLSSVTSFEHTSRNTKVDQEHKSFQTSPYAGVHQVRPIRVSPPKPGRLYPCLSDIEVVTENESDAEEQFQESDPIGDRFVNFTEAIHF